MVNISFFEFANISQNNRICNIIDFFVSLSLSKSGIQIYLNLFLPNMPSQMYLYLPKNINSKIFILVLGPENLICHILVYVIIGGNIFDVPYKIVFSKFFVLQRQISNQHNNGCYLHMLKS